MKIYDNNVGEIDVVETLRRIRAGFWETGEKFLMDWLIEHFEEKANFKSGYEALKLTCPGCGAILTLDFPGKSYFWTYLENAAIVTGRKEAGGGSRGCRTAEQDRPGRHPGSDLLRRPSGEARETDPEDRRRENRAPASLLGAQSALRGAKGRKSHAGNPRSEWCSRVRRLRRTI